MAENQNIAAPDGNAAPAVMQNASAPSEKSLVCLPQDRRRRLPPLGTAQKVLEPILSPMTALGPVLVLVILLLMQRENLCDCMIRLLDSSDLNRTRLAMDAAAGLLSTYFLTQLIDSIFANLDRMPSKAEMRSPYSVAD